LHIDLRPDDTAQALAKKLAAPRGRQSLSTFLRKAANLPPVAIGLLQEARAGKLSTVSSEEIAALTKSVPVRVTGIADIGKAISTAGGIAFDAIDARFMLLKKPGTFVAGEMLDWEAPTGGYLLQACFATGVAAGQGVLNWLKR
jgi:predicted flavoprotein YhiN